MSCGCVSIRARVVTVGGMRPAMVRNALLSLAFRRRSNRRARSSEVCITPGRIDQNYPPHVCFQGQNYPSAARHVLALVGPLPLAPLDVVSQLPNESRLTEPSSVTPDDLADKFENELCIEELSAHSMSREVCRLSKLSLRHWGTSILHCCEIILVAPSATKPPTTTLPPSNSHVAETLSPLDSK